MTDDFSLRCVSLSAERREVVGKERHAHLKSAAGVEVVGVEVGKVGEVNCRRVVDSLQGAGSVEVANGSRGRLSLGLLNSGRAF